MEDYIQDIYSDKAYHWLMFLKHNKLGFLRSDSIKLPPSKVEQDDSEDAIAAYENVNDQIIEEFGMNESFLAQKEIQKDIALLKLDYVMNGNKMKRTEWKIKEAQVEGEREQSVEMSLTKEIGMVSKNLGVGIIDIKEYSIFQYLTAKNSINNGEQ